MIRYLLEKEFKQFFRNRFLPKISVVMPLMVMLVFPLIANFEIKNINLSVVDNDRSVQSRELIEKIKSSGYFRITQAAESYELGLKSIETNQSDMLIEIPLHFEKELINEKHTTVFMAVNAVNGVKGGLGSSYLASILNEFGQNIVLEQQPIKFTQKATGFEVVPRYWYNPTLEYFKFMIPALMVMVLAIICGFLPALNIVGEKESGTIEQMNVTPVSRIQFILSKLIPYWLVGFVALTISILVARWVYDFRPVGSVGLIYLSVSLFVLAFSGFGLVVSNYAKTMQQAMFMILFFVLTFIFMSGLYTPVSNMPHWAQVVSNFSPMKFIIQIVRLVYLKGSVFSELVPHLLALIGFAVFFNTWAIISYHKKSS